jgi:hypothetical protein
MPSAKPAPPNTDATTAHGSSSAAQGETQLTVEQEIEVLKNRIEQLESEVKQNNAAAAESIKDAAALTAAEKRSRAETWSG